MEIAILGWGSLIWDPRNLKTEGLWNSDGPDLPIEFARISSSSKLTLVLHQKAENIQTLWIKSSNKDIDCAIANLQDREGTLRSKIGFVSIPDGTSNCQVIPEFLDRISTWTEEKKLDATIWTDLPSNFEEKTCKDFSDDNVVIYLRDLNEDNLKKAEEYIRRTPRQVITKIRIRVEKEFGWTSY